MDQLEKTVTDLTGAVNLVLGQLKGMVSLKGRRALRRSKIKPH